VTSNVGAVTMIALVVALTAGPVPRSPSPCGSMPLPVCSFIPLLPDLDHDVDLTTEQPAVPPPPDSPSAPDP
jgi:hypothetical protein